MKTSLENGRREGAGLRLALPRRSLRGGIGDRLGSSTGSSLEFQDYRDYHPGDDLRRLDWGAYARSDKLTVRLHRDEIQPGLDILSDISCSMLAPSDAKAKASMHLAGLFAEASFRSGCSVSWWTFGSGRQSLFRKTTFFPDVPIPKWDGSAPIEDEFTSSPPRLSWHGIRLVISDFLWEAPPESVIRRLSEGASRLILAATITEDELSPPAYGPATLLDSENAGCLELIVGDLERNSYMKRLQEHLSLWQDAAVSAGAIFCLMRIGASSKPDISALIEAGALEFS